MNEWNKLTEGNEFPKRHREWWTDQDIEALKYLTQKGETDKEIARRLKRTAPAVRRKREKEGLNKIGVKKEYIAYKDGHVVGIGTLEELAEITGRTISTLRHRTYPVGRKRAGKRGVKLYRL